MDSFIATIGISVYRQPIEWVQECVNSALSQTRQDIEVITRIDGRDGAGRKIREWLRVKAEADNRLVVMDGDMNLGNFGSLKQIFASSTAKYLIQLDADDLLHPCAVEEACAILEENPHLSFAYSNALDIDDYGEVIGPGQRQLIPFDYILMLVQFMTFHMRCIRRTSYEAVGGYRSDLLYCGDYDLSLKLAEIGDVGYLESFLYYYRIHGCNESTRKRIETSLESQVVAKSAFYRRGIALTHYLHFAGEHVSLIPWKSRTDEYPPQQSVFLDKNAFADWL